MNSENKMNKEAEQPRKPWDIPPIEIEEGKLLGLYRTFSTYDLSYIKSIIKEKDIGKKFDISVLWAMFGQQTAPSVLKDELRLLNSIRIAVENLEISTETNGGNFSPNEVRLAHIMMNRTHIVEEPGKDP